MIHESNRKINKPRRQTPDQLRYIYKVFDQVECTDPPAGCEEHVVTETTAGRRQLKLLMTREAGTVRDIWLQRVSGKGPSSKVENLLHLDRSASAKLLDLIRSLDLIPIDGDESVRIDDSLVQEFFEDPEAFIGIYEEDPSRFRRAIEEDSSATDVVAVAYRREQVVKFRRLLTDETFFQQENEVTGGGQEKTWQVFLEYNPWILGVALTGQLLTSWRKDKLEQTVAGFSIGGHGKRVDALMKTIGGISSLVFAEIKHHKTELLGKEYRTGSWTPSDELSGGVVQAQQTVYLAARDLGEQLRTIDEDGAETEDVSYFVHPRSFLIAGHLDQLRGKLSGVNHDKHRSFEVYRRSLNAPEIVTFDELLARAEWHVAVAQQWVSRED